MKPIVIRGESARKLRNLESMHRRIMAFAPLNPVEAETRVILLALVVASRSRLRREIVKKLLLRRRPAGDNLMADCKSDE